MPTKIEWCDEVWNPVTGCDPISEGCQNCYAKRMANRLQGRFGYPAGDPFRVIWHPDKLKKPTHWRKPRRIFVISMGDLFHKDVPDEYIWKVFEEATCGNRRHTYMFLTKRPERMRDWFLANQHRFWNFKQGPYVTAPWPDPCIWLGVTVENQARADERIPVLMSIPAAVHFVSVEPMLGKVDLVRWMNITYGWDWHSLIKGEAEHGGKRPKIIDWVIAGPETGPKVRPCKAEWIENLGRQCKSAGVPFFDKRDPYIRREWPDTNTSIRTKEVQ
jgi:protein gp37